MPWGEPEEDDPLDFNAVELRASEEDVKEMVRCFVEEFAWLGYDRPRLLALFQDPFYQAVHRVWVEKGGPWVTALVDEVIEDFRPVDNAAREET